MMHRNHTRHLPRPQRQRPWLTLQLRMALSYVVVTVGVVILLEILVFVLLATFINQGLAVLQPPLTSQVAQKYALLAAAQGQGTALDPHATFLPNQPATLAIPNATWRQANIPYTAGQLSRPTGFVLLITPQSDILASSFPARYPQHTPVGAVLAKRATIIDDALHGTSNNGIYTQADDTISYAAEPVWNWQKQPIGAVYVEIPRPVTIPFDFWRSLRFLLEASGIFLFIAMVPIGALFGWLTTHRLVRRILHLAVATNQFASGDYAQRVRVGGADEIGQLEDHFNLMAAELSDNIAERQELAGQNARLAERGRIARDLHDSVKQQVFAIGMQVGTALALLEQQPALAAQHMRQADALAYQAQQELTTLIHEMRPLALQTQAFFAALGDYVTTWSQRHAIAAAVDLPAPCVLPAAIEDGLLRVAQEALANVARHSQAQHVQVTLRCDDTCVTLTVMDDGCGFPPDAHAGDGVGLRSMGERLHALGGTLTIHSAPGEGTRIDAHCPIQAEEEAAHE